MKTMKYIIAILSLCAVVACKKQETMYYEGGELISFYIGRYESDSTSYTFAFHPTPKAKDTVFVNMRIQGTKQDRPRTIKVKAGEGTTALMGTDFLLPEIQIPANALTVKYPVVLLNTEKIKKEALRIVLQVDASPDLQPGGEGREIGGTQAINSYKIWFSNKANKPAYWGQIERDFGSFSVVRYQFMIKVMGFHNFSPDAIGDYGLFTYPLVLREALAKEVAAKGEPIIDENGDELSF